MSTTLTCPSDLPAIRSQTVNRLTSAVHSVLEQIQQSPRPQQAVGLATGTPGLAALFYDASRLFLRPEYFSFAGSLLERSAEEFASYPMGQTLLTGSSGYLWLFERLHRECFTTVDNLSDVANAHDEELLQSVHNSDSHTEYELLYGLTGLMHYVVCVKPTDIRRAIFSATAQKLWERAVASRFGHLISTSPHSHFRRRPPDDGDEFDLGHAHGISGVVSTLAAGSLRGIATQGTNEVMEKFAATLLGLPQQAGASLYPCIATDCTDSRLAWCYGDLCIANALLLSGRALNRSDLVAKGLSVAIHAATRDSESFGATDHAMCHGIAGLALQFSLLHKATKNEAFLTAKDKLIEQLLNAVEQKQVITESASLERDNMLSKLGLLTGLGGVAAALIHEHPMVNCTTLSDILALYH